MPAFERLHRDLAAEGLTVLGINAREGSEAVHAYAETLGLSFPLILDPTGAIATAYGVVALPTTFLIGRDGRAIARAIGPREWEGQEARGLIRTLLAERPAVPAGR
jgi:peroxiredoxin